VQRVLDSMTGAPASVLNGRLDILTANALGLALFAPIDASSRSDDFRVRRAAHDVRIHTTGVKRLHHPVVGDLELSFESFATAGDPGRSLLTDTAEPRSPSQDALNLLASWAATTEELQPPPTADSEQAGSVETPD
jgi:hypothetical protein